MEFFLKAIIHQTLTLPRLSKQIIVVVVDICLCIIATWIALYLRLDEFLSFGMGLTLPSLISVGISIPVFLIMGLYRTIFRYSGWPVLVLVFRALAIYGLIFFTILIAVSFKDVPRTLGVIQPLVLFFCVAGTRLLAQSLLGGKIFGVNKQKVTKTVVYGAGEAGRQLASILRQDPKFKFVGFLDDDEKLIGRILDGSKVWSPKYLADLVDQERVANVLLAMPSTNRVARNRILEHIARYKVTVRTLPSFSDVAEGKINLRDIRELDIDDLLGRQVVPPDKKLLSRKVSGKKILVTGAGGSIGSEICKQILQLKPATLILLEAHEYSLYSIFNQLRQQSEQSLKNDNVSLVPHLCSILDKSQTREIVKAWAPDIIYHAAAYKHVPLVEKNLFSGIKTNIFGTLNVVDAAIDFGVSDFILVSTDKAVRPASAMGATKRAAELILQAKHDNRDALTRLSMVRFGNVLASSGSVIPLFRSQIETGGPITVTHAEVNRFFMTIEEASQLVIQASAMAEGGEVFLLDMGEPVKIIDLARRMIRLSGLSEKTRLNPNGDIEIKIVGMRHGEKLFEELLIGDGAMATDHPKILKARESCLPLCTVVNHVEELQRQVAKVSEEGAVLELARLVSGFRPNSEMTDLIYSRRNDVKL